MWAYKSSSPRFFFIMLRSINFSVSVTIAKIEFIEPELISTIYERAILLHFQIWDGDKLLASLPSHMYWCIWISTPMPRTWRRIRGSCQQKCNVLLPPTQIHNLKIIFFNCQWYSILINCRTIIKDVRIIMSI